MLLRKSIEDSRVEPQRMTLKKYRPNLSRIAGGLALLLCPTSMPVDAATAQSVLNQGLPIERNLWLIQAEEQFSVANASGPRGKPLPLDVTLPPQATENYSFLMFRNMPQDFRLSAGFGTEGYWAVAVPDADELEMLPTQDFTGAFVLETLLVRTVGDQPDRALSNIAFLPEAGASASDEPVEQQSLSLRLDALGSPFAGDSAANPTAALGSASSDRAQDNAAPSILTNTPPDAVPDDAPARTPVELKASDQALFQRGNTLLEQGNLAAARLIYRRLALKNHLASALALASTYDPDFLARINVRGLQPDVEDAMRWYKLAAELGSDVAAQRLRALSAQLASQ